MNNLKICLVQVPSKPEEDYNQGLTKWVNGRLIEFDEGKFINYYIRHEDEPGENGVITSAFQIRVEKPVTHEKIIASVEKDVYDLYTDEDYSNFQASLVRKLQDNPQDPFIQSHTKLIRWVENGLNLAKGITAEEAKSLILQNITDFDTSTAVNSFILNGIPAWLDKETRVGLMNSVTIEKAAGFEKTTLWLDTKSFTLPVDTAIGFLYQLELYAKQCYNKTAEHKYNISLLNNPDEILEYNYKEGYPEKLSINV